MTYLPKHLVRKCTVCYYPRPSLNTNTERLRLRLSSNLGLDDLYGNLTAFLVLCDVVHASARIFR